MDVIESRSGQSWIVRDGAREVGLVTISRGGRHGHVGYAAWSAVVGRDRYDLGVHTSVEGAAARVSAFDADPDQYLPRVTRVLSEVVERRR